MPGLNEKEGHEEPGKRAQHNILKCWHMYKKCKSKQEKDCSETCYDKGIEKFPDKFIF